MDLDLGGKHALVCGGSAGIGRAAAIALAELGADVTVLSRSREALDALVRTLPKPKPGQGHAWIDADVADTATLRAKVEAAGNARPFAILVNNTAGPAAGAIVDATAEQFLDTFQRHLLANHALVQALVPGMRRIGYGRIVNVISTSVREPIRGLGVSNTIRGAVASWAKTLATELGPDGITVNNVLPGYTRTQRLDEIIAGRVDATGKDPEAIAGAMRETVPLRRFAEAREVGDVIAFLASPAAAYVSGVSVPVDGGRMQSL